MSVASLSKRWITAKDRIRELQEELIGIEAELLNSIESMEGGTKTNHLDGYKIVVKRPINRTIDGEKWEKVKDRIPSEYWPIKIKTEPDAKGCEWLAAEKPELWLIAAEAITEKPGKPGFTVEAEE